MSQDRNEEFALMLLLPCKRKTPMGVTRVNPRTPIHRVQTQNKAMALQFLYNHNKGKYISECFERVRSLQSINAQASTLVLLAFVVSSYIAGMKAQTL
jgi:hypothetical protein